MMRSNTLGVEVEEGGDRIDAGVVDQDVDRAELLHTALRQLGARRRVGHVGLDGPGLAPLLTELLGGDLGRPLVDVADQHVGARLGHAGRDAKTDPHRPAGHDRALARQIKRSPPSHRHPLLVCRSSEANGDRPPWPPGAAWGRRRAGPPTGGAAALSRHRGGTAGAGTGTGPQVEAATQPPSAEAGRNATGTIEPAALGGCRGER